MSNWTRSDNFIKNVAERSFIGAKGIFDSFDCKLNNSTDPEVMGYYNTFHPLCLIYDEGYGKWSSLRSGSPSKTLGVVQLLDQLSSTKIKAWDIAIQSVYDNTSMQYKGLLPHHRIPFQSGKTNSRAIAINDLITAIGDNTSLVTLKTNVTDFYELLTAAMLLQKSLIINIDLAIQELEAASNAASEEAFRIYGGFVMKFYKTPKHIDMYFPVGLLQSVSQSSFTATLSNKKPRKIFKRKLDITKHTLKYTSIGTDVVNGYFNNGFTDVHTPGTPIFAMQPNTMAEINPAEMGYTDTNRHLHIINTGLGSTFIEVDIMLAN